MVDSSLLYLSDLYFTFFLRKETRKITHLQADSETLCPILSESLSGPVSCQMMLLSLSICVGVLVRSLAAQPASLVGMKKEELSVSTQLLLAKDGN